MALKFLNKTPASSPFKSDAEIQKTHTENAAKFAPEPKAQAAAPAKAPTSSVGWMKRGQEAKKAIQEQAAKEEMAKAARDRMFRFRMKVGGSALITFLDGALDADGMLDAPMFYEHQVKLAGNWENFICTSEQEGHCPICDKGESKAALVAVFTVIDHTPYTIQSGPNAGKTIKDTRKLFVAKKDVRQLLAKRAAKNNGLVGCTFEVERIGEKSAAVGSQFEFVEKQTIQAVAAKYGLKPEDVAPADYTKEFVYRSVAELVEAGVGKAHGGIGYEKPLEGGSFKDQM